MALKGSQKKYGDKAGEEISFGFLLLDHLQKIANVSMEDDRKYFKSVKTLEILLIPYYSEAIKKELKELRDEHENHVSGLGNATNIFDNPELAKAWLNYTERKFSLLMELIKEKGLMPNTLTTMWEKPPWEQ